ncbi:MAG: family 10 glycosylhydrolase [Candidatus Cloacimonadales bacterium]|nr:family 10 glycosylhydrolase [Candidatus Cloacimonadales bacterium]
MKIVKIIIYIFFIFNVNFLKAEIKALWVPIWEINRAGKIDTLFLDIEDQEFDQLLVQVRYRGDAAYIPNKRDASFPNPEKKYFGISDSTFDPLEYIIDKAEEREIEVHAWFTTFIITGHDLTKLDSSHVFFTHPEWITSQFTSQPMDYQEDMGAFLDPGIPEVQDYTLNVILDVVANYAIDGIHLDYIRYPGTYFGFNELAKKTFKAEVKYQDANSWQQWKLDQVTRFVAKVSQSAKEISPEIRVSAAVFSDADEAHEKYSQDWMFWLDKGYIDEAYTMSYTTSTKRLEQDLTFLKNYKLNDKIVIGLRAWENGNSYPAGKIKEKIKVIGKLDYAGFALFSYSGIKQAEYFKNLKIK